MASISDVRCGPRKFLLFSAKDLVANDVKKLDATMIKDLAGLPPVQGVLPRLAADRVRKASGNKLEALLGRS
jgi:hypothetical protein